MTFINPDGTYEVPCRECGQQFDFASHNETPAECEATMRRITNGERGCANAGEHHTYEAATPVQR